MANSEKAQKKKEMLERCKGRTPEQQSVICYFYGMPKGCIGKVMTDAEYDTMVSDYLKKNNYFKDRAISKIGLDESEISLIAPVCVRGYHYNSKNGMTKFGKDLKWRSSQYQVSWLFFSETQVYLYQNTTNFNEDGKKESSEEYFYKDIVNFASTAETEERPTPVKAGCLGKEVKWVLKNVDMYALKIVVPGDAMFCSADVTDDSFENSVKGMKNLLRDKKNNG